GRPDPRAARRGRAGRERGVAARLGRGGDAHGPRPRREWRCERRRARRRGSSDDDLVVVEELTHRDHRVGPDRRVLPRGVDPSVAPPEEEEGLAVVGLEALDVTDEQRVVARRTRGDDTRRDGRQRPDEDGEAVADVEVELDALLTPAGEVV